MLPQSRRCRSEQFGKSEVVGRCKINQLPRRGRKTAVQCGRRPSIFAVLNEFDEWTALLKLPNDRDTVVSRRVIYDNYLKRR
jgi:hypothetical protein